MNLIAGTRRDAAPRQAFTLLEIIIVVAVIALLAGMLIPVGIALRQQARQTQTKIRMQNILNALSIYGHDTSDRCYNLQLACGLGGTGEFDSLEHIWNNNSGVSTVPPPIDVIIFDSGHWYSNLFDSTNYQNGISINGTNYVYQVTADFRLFGSQVFETVPPPNTTWSASNFTSVWPTQWPETDWDLASPGTHPPILRFPWGKIGLRIDGKLCDPSVPEGTGYPMPTNFQESTTSRGFIDSVTEVTGNSWATMGAPATGRIWSWSTTNANQTDWVTLRSSMRSDGSSASPIDTNGPMPFDMGWMSPLATIQLLQVAGIVPPGIAGANQYRTDRTPSQPWNDAWGNPLVVVYALFQPERYSRVFDSQNRRDLLLRGALEAYHYNRSVYLAVAAPGQHLDTVDYPNISTNWASSQDGVVLSAYWKQVRSVCGAVNWNESAFTAPPWKDVQIGKLNSCLSLLTAPTEIK
jgi:prepilin-type N-terminal cleavage/methylation domain-containing protein